MVKLVQGVIWQVASSFWKSGYNSTVTTVASKPVDIIEEINLDIMRALTPDL